MVSAELRLCDAARPTTIASGGLGRRSWEFMYLPHEEASDLNAGERGWDLLEPRDQIPENTRLERRTLHTFAGTWADP